MTAGKLKSRRGASIIIALLVLLICATAGAAALTAASANAGRYTHMRRDQQRYLAVSSAVKLVRSELAGQSFSSSAKMEEAKSYTDPETGEVFIGQIYIMEPEDQLIAPAYSGVFSGWLLDDLGKCFKAREIPASWWSQTGGGSTETFDGVTYTGLGMDTDAAEPLLDQVKWTLTLDDDYSITARFWLDDEGKTYYPTTLTLPATRQEDTQTEQVGVGQRWVTTKTVTVTWSGDDVTITQG